MEHKKKRADLTYVISSHPKYSKALAPLLDSMYVAGINPHEIIVVLSECAKDTCSNYALRSGIRYVTIKNNIFEYGGNIGAIKSVEDGIIPRTNDFVMIHDTCIAGKDFKKRCQELQSSSSSKIIWATPPDGGWRSGGAFNIGIYRYEAARYVHNLLRSTLVMDKNFAIEMEHGKNYMSIKNMPISQHFCQKNMVNLGKYDVYQEGRPRDVVYIPSIDLYKMFFWVPHGSEHPNKIG